MTMRSLQAPRPAERPLWEALAYRTANLKPGRDTEEAERIRRIYLNMLPAAQMLYRAEVAKCQDAKRTMLKEETTIRASS